MKIESVNPASEERTQDYSLRDNATVQKIIRGAHRTHLSWRRTAYDGELPGPVAAIME